MARNKKVYKPKSKKIPYKNYLMESRQEVIFAKECDKKKLIWEYETDYFELVIRQIYTPDFKITLKNGYIFYVEYKGYLWKEDKTKMLAVKRQYPDVDIRFVFLNHKKPIHGAQMRKDGTKMSHGEWAETHGFKWSEGFMPSEWFNTKGGERK